MAGIEIEIELSENLSIALQTAIDAAIDLTPVMGDIAGHLADTTRERFETQRSPQGVPWARRRDDADAGRPILTLRGYLRDSIREDWGKDYAAAGPEASGASAIYAAIHQLGGTIRAKAGKALSFAGRIVAAVRIPARPYVGWNDVNSDYAVDALGEHMLRAFSAPGVSA